MCKIILASKSPRRRELLKQIGWEFEVMAACGEEKITEEDPGKVVEELAAQKASEIFSKYQCHGQEDFLVIGADTVVVYEGKILGKPKDEEDARRTLSMLSGQWHQVYTGVCMQLWQHGEKKQIVFAEKTEVHMYDISEDEITSYLASGEPMDKAGSYGIQGNGARFIKEIAGDYNNVVGLPIAKVYQTWKEFNQE